ncbi:hypothetical protein HDU96_008372 [Phlyctochytrium bullatum]|nr:hypothetical protein HDU96_008372 [Phlyctochytrium bullatum]
MAHVPEEDTFEDFICKECIGIHPFLTAYSDNKLFNFQLHADTERALLKRKLERDEGEDEPAHANGAAKETKTEDGVASEKEANESVEGVIKIIEPEKDAEGKACPVKCKLDDILENLLDYNLFLSEGWKDELCRCDNCINEQYKEIPFIVVSHQNEVTGQEVFEPEPDTEATLSLLDLGMKQLQRMDRIAALEGVRAYKEMADEIKGFLKDFAEAGKVVTSDDVHKFFDGLRAKALPRSTAD